MSGSMLIRTYRLSYLAPAKGHAGHDVVLLKDVTVGIPALAPTGSAIEVGQDRNLSGAVTVLLGPSGSGKTTLMKLLGAQPMRGKLCGHVLHGTSVVLPATDVAKDAVPPSSVAETWTQQQKQQQPSPTTRKPRVAYVFPTDVHYRDLTIGETMFYAARLTLPYTSSDEDVQSRCLEVARLFGLDSKLGLRVESPTLTLLDRRLLSLAEALLSPADALLVEDPMRGLDALQCIAAATALRDVARAASVAVVYPLHGAADSLFSLCDRAIMLRKGAVLYEGDISMFESFLRSALTNPEDIRALEQSGMHPVSFILRGAAEIDRLHAREWGVSESEWSRQLEVIAVYNDKSRSATSNSVSDGALIPNYSFGLERSTSGKANEVSLSLDRAPADQSQQPVPSSPEPAAHNDVPTLLLDPVVEEWVRPIRRLRNKICSPVPPILSIDSGRKLSVLFKRSFVVYSRSIFGAKLVILRSLILGIIVGILYYKSGENFDEDALVLDPVTKFNEESYNLFSLMYLICLVVVFMAGTSIPAYFEMHRVCEREIQNSWYHPFSSVLATMAVDTPILMASTVAFSAIVYRMTELRGPESWFYGGVAVLACVGYAQARFCVAVARHPLFAFMLFVVMWAFELMLSGAMIPESYILLWDWALDVNFSYWGVRLLENNEFKGFNEPYGDLLLNAFGFLYTDKIDCIAYMFVFFVIFTLIYLVALYPNPQRLISIPPGEFSRILISMLALDDCEDDSVQDSVDPSHRRSVRMVQLSTRTTNANSSSALTEPLTGDSSSYRNNDAAAPTNATPAPQAQPVRTSPAWTREAALRYAYDAGIALLKLLEMLVHINYDYSYRAVMLEHRTRPLDNVQTPRSETATSPAVSRLTLAPDRRVTIVFHKLSYALPSFKLQQGLSSLALRMMAKVSSKPVELVPVLKHVSGIAKSAELCLVLGVQGSGKGTLFEVLNEAFRCANRSDQAAPIERRGVQGGNIYVNGCLLQTRDGAGLAMSTHRASSIVGPMQNQPSWSSVSFVASDDTLNTMLTVREHLRYSLLLRRQNSIALSSAEELRSVDDLVQDLLVLHSLDRVQDSCVGLPQHRSLTQGQMRRLAIALGVSSGSSILFLAAPLADLPHECVRSVSACLQTLAFSGRTVICSATGMSGQDMKLYHRLLLIHNGYSLYSGRTQDFASFMEMRFSLIPRPKQSVADFALSLSRGELLSGIVDNRYEQQIQAGLIAPNISSSKDGQAFSSRNTLVGSLNAPVNTSVLTMLAAVDEEVVSRLNRSYSMAQPLDVRRSVFTDALPKSVSSRVGFFINELLTLLDRDSRSVLRRPYWIVVAARAAVLGLLVGSIFYNTDASDTVSRMGLFFAAHMVVNLWVVELVPALHAEKRIFLREVRSGVLRGPVASALTMGLPAMWAAVPITLVFCLPIYFLGNLRSGIAYFINFYLALLLSQVYNLALAYLVAFSTPNVPTNLIVYPGIFVPICWIFCGYLVLYTTLSDWLQWAVRVDYCFWFMSATFANEFRDSDGVAIDGVIDIYGYTEAVGVSLGCMAAALLVVRILHLAVAAVCAARASERRLAQIFE